VESCVFKAIELVEKDGRKVARVDELLCEGCGVCAATCCNKAMEVSGYYIDQLVPMIRSMIQEVE
jgi:heterodisulfide reductase subunit A